MRRLHLFEFGDQAWFPRLLRDAETCYLTTCYRFVPLPGLWAEKMVPLFRPGEQGEIVDLCSGSGGPIPLLLKELALRGVEARATLTDLYPSDLVHQAVDATRVPDGMTGIRTLFSGFHHFRPESAKAILRSAFDAGCAICVFEAVPRLPSGLIPMLLVPLNVLAMMPLVRPVRWSYLALTYLIPLIPLLILWDGVVSMLRMYSPAQMRQMTEDLRRPDYSWETGTIPLRGVAGGVPYLIGRAGAGTGSVEPS